MDEVVGAWDGLLGIFQLLVNLVTAAFDQKARDNLVAQFNGIVQSLEKILGDLPKALRDLLDKVIGGLENMNKKNGTWYTVGYVIGVVSLTVALALVGAAEVEALTNALKGTKLGKTALKVAGKAKKQVGKAAKAVKSLVPYFPETKKLRDGTIAYKSKEELWVRSKEYLKRDGKIKWPPKEGFVLNHAGQPIMKKVSLKKGQILDRYGSPEGRFTNPVNGEPASYKSRGLPYPESEVRNQYHQYRVVKDITPENIKKGMEKLSKSDRKKFDDYLIKWEVSFNDIATVQKGKISPVFDGGGGTQLQFKMSIHWYEKLGLLKEIKP